MPTNLGSRTIVLLLALALAPGLAHATPSAPATPSPQKLELPNTKANSLLERTVPGAKRRNQGAGSTKRKKQGKLDLPTHGRYRPEGSELVLEEPSRPDTGPDLGSRSGAQRATSRDAGVAAESRVPLTGSSEALEARALLDGLADTRDPGASRVRRTGDELVLLGPDALPACREAIDGKNAGAVVASARAMLALGGDADRARVIARFDKKLPRGDAELLIGAIEDTAPALLTPEFLGDLFEHPQGAVRSAAERRLRAMPPEDALPVLVNASDSERSDTRLRALGLLASGDSPEAVEIFFEHLGDTSAQVAWRAAEALAAMDDPAVHDRLMVLATGETLLLRRNAYALLAVCEYEDRTSLPLLHQRDAPLFLDNLGVSQPLAVGAAAVALAGIGFRSPRPEETSWLDRVVPHLLVRTVSGAEYHRDLSSLRGLSARRLVLLSGESLSNDGRAWQQWWIQRSADFRARRAYLSLGSLGPAGIEVRFRAPAEGNLFRLMGESATDISAGPDVHGEVFYLTQAECEDLAAVLEGEGLFSAERLPGIRGRASGATRTLEVVVGHQAKAFTFGPRESEEWFERAASAARGLGDRNRWQRYVDSSRHVSRRELWLEERDWWARVQDGPSRARRMKQLVLAALPSVPVSRRDGGTAELLRAFAIPGVAEASDFQPLLDLLRQEPFYRDRAVQLSELSRQVAREISGQDVPIETELARELAKTLYDTFGVDCADQLVLLLAECGREVIQEMASDERPFVRAVTAGALARRKDPEDVPLLLGMLDDPDPDVEASVVRSLGRNRIEAARTEILLRSRVADRRVRVAALEALAHLGGADAVEPLMLAVGESDPAIRDAAAEGLAVLADPRTTDVLVSILARGPAEPTFDAARRGLLAIGEPAWTELLRVASSAATVSRREAALVLSEQGVSIVGSTLMALLTEAPGDPVLSRELATLTCIDFRREPDPASAWWEWWDQVRHDDSMAWFRAGLSRENLDVPSPEALRGRGTLAGARFLLGLLESEEDWLVERARRELGRLLDRDLGAVPPPGSGRELWLEELARRLESHWADGGAALALEREVEADAAVLETDTVILEEQ